jgi:hypothetical protein
MFKDMDKEHYIYFKIMDINIFDSLKIIKEMVSVFKLLKMDKFIKASF